MVDVAFYGKQQQQAPPSIPSLPIGCCRTDLSPQRHVIESGRDLLSVPTGRHPLSSPGTGVAAGTPWSEADTAAHILLKEFQRLQEDQVEANKRLQEQMLTLDGKLNHLLQNKELIYKLMNLAVGGDVGLAVEGGLAGFVERNGSREGEQRKRQTEAGNGEDASYANGDGRESQSLIKRKQKSRKSRATKIKAETASANPATYFETTEEQVRQHVKQKAKPTEEIEPKGVKCIARIVFTSYFDASVAFCVVLNSILVGVQVNHDASNGEDVEIFFHLECYFIALFTLEFILRMIAAGNVFCIMADPPYIWPIFDTILVVVSWADLALMIAGYGKGLPGPAASVAKALKLARMARIMRFLRMTKLLNKVGVMGTIIVGSLSSLIWLFLLIATIMYIFALLLTQGASDWMKSNDDESQTYGNIRATFGTVPQSMLTLFESVTGGLNWGEPNSLAAEIGALHSFVFSFFIFFFFFSVLNIVTGVYVDGAIQQAHNDRTVKEIQKEKDKKAAVQLLSEALQQIDTDDSGCISRVEWIEAMNTSAVRNIMELLEVDISDAHKLFDLVDLDADDALNITEFVDGMRKLRGNASSIDVHVIMCRLNHLISQIRHLFIDPSSEKFVYKHVRDSSAGLPEEHQSPAWKALKAAGIV